MLSRDQLKLHAVALAGIHDVSLLRPAERLLTRLKENDGVLTETCDLLMLSLKTNSQIVQPENGCLTIFI